MSKIENKTVETRIPLIQTGHALQSLRDSGHSLPTALGEVIDNSLEANANHIWIRLDESTNTQGKKHVHRIAVSDDGEGMDSNILHHYLQLGFSTRYMSKDTIGKYGVGAKLAALNFGRHIDVWSRHRENDPWLYVSFDLDKTLEGETNGEEAALNPPSVYEVPKHYQDLLPKGTGTLVVWSHVDRLEEGRMAENFEGLRLELEKELSRIFRHFIDGGIKLSINGKGLIHCDPLMLMKNSWADDVLSEHYKKVKKKESSVKEHYAAKEIADERIKVADSNARVRITLYPNEVIRKRGLGGDTLAKKLRVPDNQGCISFIRMNREVSYTNVPRIFPSGVKDPDRFIGIEVSFKPDLDDYFGIRNVKRGVEPHGELRKKIRILLQKYLKTARDEVEEIWGKASREEGETKGEHSAVIAAVKDVDRTMPKGRAEGPSTEADVEQALKDLAKDVGYEKQEEQKSYIDRIKDLPFVIESVDFPGNMFVNVQHLSGKVIIRLNTRHPFYRDMWEPIKEISQRDPGTVSGDEAVKTARRTIEAMTLMLIAYGKAESMDINPTEKYEDLVMYWGQFLSTMMGKVKNVL